MDTHSTFALQIPHGYGHTVLWRDTQDDRFHTNAGTAESNEFSPAERVD
jgi:hypothetical protein